MLEENNQRLAKRAILRVSVSFSAETGSTGVGRTLDISTGGLCVVTENPLPINARLTVTFEVRVKDKPVSVVANAQVKWCMLSNYQYKSGLEFMSVSSSNRDTIEALVSSAPNLGR